MTPLTPICSDPLHTLAAVLVPVLFFSKGNPLEDSLELKADTGTCFCGWLLRNQTNMVSTGPEAASAWTSHQLSVLLCRKGAVGRTACTGLATRGSGAPRVLASEKAKNSRARSVM